MVPCAISRPHEALSKLLTYGRFATLFESPLSFSSVSMLFQQGDRFFESPPSFAMVLCIFTISMKHRILNSTDPKGPDGYAPSKWVVVEGPWGSGFSIQRSGGSALEGS